MKTKTEKTSKKISDTGTLIDKTVVATGLLVLMAFLLLTGCQKQPQENTINVQGTSQLMYKPDQASVFAGISILKPTAQEAQTEANQVINAIIMGLNQLGIPNGSIETQQLSLYEESVRNENGSIISQGWRAAQMLKIKTTDMTKVGQIVDACVSNGANQISSINFELSPQKENEYKQAALAEASKNAKAKAETIAASLGVSLGNIKTVVESNAFYLPYAYSLKRTSGDDAVSEAAAVLPSEVTVSATVNLEYYIG